MKLNIEEIEHIAELARLDLTEAEKEKYTEQLSVVLDYIDMLNELDTEGIEETCQVTGLEDVVRDDKVEECDEETRRRLIELFPKKEGEQLKVRGVFEN